MNHEMPHPASQSAVHRRFSFTPQCREFVIKVCGGPIPPEIIDEEALDGIYKYMKTFGMSDGPKRFKEDLPRELRVQLRAVRINVAKLRAQNGGKLPWDQ